MEFEWDDEKERLNILKHLVDFDTATALFFDPKNVVEEDPFCVGEQRFIAIGYADGRLLAAVYSEPAEGVVRLISARKATRAERKLYETSF
jgi:hypothetical protein